jgi:UDP-glucose 4-epimerase
MIKHILVTGAYGFVGRHVAREAAAAGMTVTAIGHGSWDRGEYRQWGIDDWHAATIDLESLMTHAGPADVIFHCAGSGSVAFSLSNPFQDFGRTVATTLAVLEFVRLHRPNTKVIIPSSAGVYGVTQRGPISVEQRSAPVSPYGLHKCMAEDLVRSFGLHYGLNVAITRLFSVYGIGLRKQLWWDACRKLSAGDAEFNGTGLETRDWLHVQDAAQLMLVAAAHASSDCPVVNGGVGEAVPIRSVVEALAGHLGVTSPVIFKGFPRPGDPFHYQADIEQALAWGWSPQHQWESEAAAYADWYKRGAL